ncbi:putative hydrolase of the HAD superfamily [Candidatus Magnetomoraceae bacterium gMMP-13]
MKTVLFDLDNTLYPAEKDLFPLMDKRINKYMNEIMGIPQEDVDRLRLEYWCEYGLTLMGLMRHHKVDPEDYLMYIHDLDIESHLGPDPNLRKSLESLSVRKIVFTNSCKEYAVKVLSSLKIIDLFDEIFDIRLAEYQPKPYPEPYLKILTYMNLTGNKCVMVEDSEKNLKTAKELGMQTILVGKKDTQPYVDSQLDTLHEISNIPEKFFQL